jgi:hypothetical protein
MLRPAVSQPAYLGAKHISGAQDQIFVAVRQLRVCWYQVPSLTRWWVCCLQLLLALTSTIILVSESCGSYDHILLAQIQDSPNLEGHVPVFISPRNRVTQLYPQALDSFFVTTYNSQGYSGGIWTCLHAENSQCTINFLCSLSMDHTENTNSNSPSIVACTYCLAMALVLLHVNVSVA